MLRDLFLRFCLFLEVSQGYEEAKTFARNLLDNPRYPYKRYFDLAMILLVLLSVALLVYSVDNEELPWMLWLEDFAVTVFVVEYLARLWIVGDMHHTILEHMRQTEFLHLPFRLRTALLDVVRIKWNYVISPLAIIDLLAILPSYRPIRILRVFLLFRLFKLFRYSRSVHGMTGVLSEHRFEFYTLAFFMIFVITAAASSIYVFEGALPGSTVNTFFDALYWAMVTLSTVGYGDTTYFGRQGRHPRPDRIGYWRARLFHLDRGRSFPGEAWRTAGASRHLGARAGSIVYHHLRLWRGCTGGGIQARRKQAAIHDHRSAGRSGQAGDQTGLPGCTRRCGKQRTVRDHRLA
ncbi:MAG: potassium channel family protein [Gammaproteobacteria bacterium]|nr:potassium channel family protein [Gammaproteobacteria bacterium]